jgi:hypothetical protein
LSPEKELGTDPIGPDEVIFRRILEYHYKPKTGFLSKNAFKPRPADETGISVCRAKYLPEPKAESAAHLGRAGMRFWVAEIRAKLLFDAGMGIEPDPDKSTIAHARIPILNSAIAGSDQTQKELIDKASRLPWTVHGPFLGRTPAPV